MHGRRLSLTLLALVCLALTFAGARRLQTSSGAAQPVATLSIPVEIVEAGSAPQRREVKVGIRE